MSPTTSARRLFLLPACALALAACDADDARDAALTHVADSIAAVQQAEAAAAAAADSARRADSIAVFKRDSALAAGDTAPPPLAAVVPLEPAAPAEPASPSPAAPAPSQPGAQTAGPVTPEAVAAYQLNMARVRTLVAVGRNLAELQQRNPALQDSMRAQGTNPNAMYQAMERHPEVRQAITSAGMTPREYAIASVAVVQAAMAAAMRRAGQEPPVQVNEANVRFLTENEAEIRTLMQQMMGSMMPRQP